MNFGSQKAEITCSCWLLCTQPRIFGIAGVFTRSLNGSLSQTLPQNAAVGQIWKCTVRKNWEIPSPKTWGPVTAYAGLFIMKISSIWIVEISYTQREAVLESTRSSLHSLEIWWTLAHKRPRSIGPFSRTLCLHLVDGNFTTWDYKLYWERNKL